MGLFGGRGKGQQQGNGRQAAAIAQFWSWWIDEGMARSSTALADGDPGRIVADLTARVEAVAADLTWEFAKGDTSMHRLVVTADGDPHLRAAARRWLEAAPEGDVFWSYADARPPMLDLGGAQLELDGTTLALDQVRVGVHRSGTRVDVQVHHPSLEQLSPGARNTFCFLAVDAAVGELLTETWIGELEPAVAAPIDSFGLTGLRAVVRDLADEFSGDNQWVALEGVGAGGPVHVLARVPLAAASAPTLNQCVMVVLTGLKGENGLPDDESRARVDTFRDHLVDRLEGQGELVAVLFAAGECLLYFYVDGERTGAEQLRAAVRGWPGKARVEVEDDPGWANVAHLRG
ncbi:DUF695 domain-containing protein [Yimella sp. cx-51]|uniref:DUF695 domain-containing protein n=1 Tax=Yimella sp. cx-51 TaxID=2770551 RepID=UPI00165E0F31|nr:DUF695 domain-containing protein [Yimella sp. cx-51]MBC9957470.1 DUF695 domain-containing protein [Yimella sp. cx-51]QTH39296.1 DUF695 domain-containing protein [Yimella sp. cx-51]